ncbi:hypothetical protein KAFR_0A00170 [Kazachstania africana CBS 2517]|uniref:IPT/TIG domain-containing protein n=1 Tax=Kazachstania africana (strain ATCC 22294 / BCRC 22015 / CBS 2517 / CECT 1963 / NBRC 1671 / NRRL Y-8276) TaxID=1071382 RepID=H2AM55_KAZAF|nr:hypothetical protein KAFR_0A00170 [Kazachstania africana CBS 2517]CCF55455.1 hypothetical protein KAFR_0A00170 [Kazachstania africana CBS 2517]
METILGEDYVNREAPENYETVHSHDREEEEGEEHDDILNLNGDTFLDQYTYMFPQDGNDHSSSLARLGQHDDNEFINSFIDVDTQNHHEDPFHTIPAIITKAAVASEQTSANDSVDEHEKFQSFLENTILFGRKQPLTNNMNSEEQSRNLYNLLNIDETKLPQKLSIEGLPDATRVENQLKLTFKLSPSSDKFMIHLPNNAISREKFYLNKDINQYPETLRKQLLFLDAFLLDYASNSLIQACAKCVNRECRRAARRKSGLSDNLLWCNNDNRNAVLFNSKQILFAKNHTSERQFETVARIVCYCRHHKSNDGFKILFALKDNENNLVAKGLSKRIWLTDKKAVTSSDISNTVDEQVPTLSNTLRTDSQAYTSNSNSETSNQYYDAEPTFALPTNTRIMNGSRVNSLNVPFRNIPSPTSLSEGGNESISSEYLNNYNDYASSSVTTHSFMNSNRSSRKRSKNERQVIPSTFNPVNNLHQIHFTNIDLPSQNVPENSEPAIQRVIPSKGPVNGGTEVTLLGSHFKEGLEIRFGDNLALSTQCWSTTTIVTYLPPANTAGQVYVTVKDPSSQSSRQAMANFGSFGQNASNNDPSKKAIFTYVDETDRQLIELALQIVGLKMNGKLEDARNVAKRIVGDDNNNSTSSPGSKISPINDVYNMGTSCALSDENLIIKVINSLNKTTSNFSMCDSVGRTLLHLASLKGYYDLTSTLIQSGARIDDKDSFGFTPLHFACINGSYQVIRLLLNCQSNPNVKSSNHLSPKDLFIKNHQPSENDFFKIIDVLDNFTEFSNMHFNRKASQTSFDSSIFQESAKGVEPASVNFENLRHDTDLVDDDCDFEDNNELSHSDGSYSEGSCSESEEETTGASEVDSSLQISNSNSNATPENENGNSTNEGSLWVRVLNRINDDLPKYEDLFPGLGLNSDKNNQKNSDVTSIHTTISTSNEESHVSSEDEEEALQRKFNIFFINNKRTFQNDKMLQFFWLPLALLLLTWAVLFIFSANEDSQIVQLSNLITSYLRVGLGKIILGNQRMKRSLKDKFSNFQNTGKLNDLIVG